MSIAENHGNIYSILEKLRNNKAYRDSDSNVFVQLGYVYDYIENGNNITIDLTLFKVVDTLPVSDIDVNKIYLLPNPAGADNNTYIEYMYINGRWEVVGEYKAEMSLDNYYTKGEADEKFLTKAEAGNLADYVKNGELDTKVGEAGYVKIDAVNAAIGTKIDGFRKIVMLTTSEYNSLVSSGTVDTNTVYMTYDA